MQKELEKSINEASKVIGTTWPLYSFVTSNPLSGYEQAPFPVAVAKAKTLLDATMFPETALFKEAWEKGEINRRVVCELLRASGFTEEPNFYLVKMDAQKSIAQKNKNHQLDSIMAKWLAAFMDEGLAEWEMPGKEAGFYQAWRKLARFDTELGIKSIKDIPMTSSDALEQVLADKPAQDYVTIFSNHLAALPGWTGYINYRNAANSVWQEAYPITLQDYLGVRFYIAKQLKLPLLVKPDVLPVDKEMATLQLIWLQAWEQSWQQQLAGTLKDQAIRLKTADRQVTTPEAQLVFCIDTRSELIRRHVEDKGNYETFGYAGFFGIAMDYSNMDDGLSRKSCPPIVASAYRVSEAPQEGKRQNLDNYGNKVSNLKFWEYFLKRMKNMLPSAFGFVEGSGFFYGFYLLLRTLLPAQFYRFIKKNTPTHEAICTPVINDVQTNDSLVSNIPLEEKVGIVKSAFALTGWKEFAPLVLFVGHGSHSANNPFGSSLDCGACAASPGRHNARMLASLANEPEVRKAMADEHGIAIPETTVFIGAEHNTTTDAIVLFDSQVPSSHESKLAKVKKNLELAQETATQERLGNTPNSIAKAEGKANHWSETRPEWGLAKNAGFIVAPRALTQAEHLDGRCFLHSYDWEMDTTGAALEGIMQGPMVVTQWINNHYYFSMVDNDTFGGGTKITHNVTGRFGVVQGNGGDLKMGLPLQSLRSSDTQMYHKPLRLSVVINAPKSRIEEILLRNENLRSLLNNEWIYLLVMDPTDSDTIKRYRKDMTWEIEEGKATVNTDFPLKAAI